MYTKEQLIDYCKRCKAVNIKEIINRGSLVFMGEWLRKNFNKLKEV